MKRRWLVTVLCFVIGIGAGCQQNAGPFGTFGNQEGTNDEGIVSGKGYTSIYQEANSNKEVGDRKGGRFFSIDRDLGMNRDFDLGKTKTPGNRLSRNSIPYGFAKHGSNDADVIYQGYGAQFYLDRQIMAEAISQIVVGMQNITTATVLITDEECIIGFQGVENNNQNLQEQVRKAGLSVTPRWFHVYATDNPEVLSQISNLGSNPEGHNLTVEGLDNRIRGIVKQLANVQGEGKNPQSESESGME
jgi:hypothetical protein